MCVFCPGEITVIFAENNFAKKNRATQKKVALSF